MIEIVKKVVDLRCWFFEIGDSNLLRLDLPGMVGEMFFGVDSAQRNVTVSHSQRSFARLVQKQLVLVLDLAPVTETIPNLR
jgi:hypothetical protein